jgi:hypothetical protein
MNFFFLISYSYSAYWPSWPPDGAIFHFHSSR